MRWIRQDWKLWQSTSSRLAIGAASSKGTSAKNAYHTLSPTPIPRMDIGYNAQPGVSRGKRDEA